MACPHCGYYNGRQVLKISSKIEKRAKRNKIARGDKKEKEVTEPKKAETKTTKTAEPKKKA